MSDIQKLKEAKEEKFNVLTELKESLNEGEVFNEEQTQQWDAVKAELDDINTQIETQERLLSLPAKEEEAATVSYSKKFTPSISFSKKKADPADAFRGWALSQVNRKEHLTSDMIEAGQKSNVAFDAPISGSVSWDQTTNVDPSGGFSVNDEVVAGVVRKMKDFGGMLSTCHVFNTSDGAPLRKVVHDSTNFKAQKTDELGQIQNTAQILDKVSFGACELTSGIYQTSMQLVRDSSYDILGEFQNAVGESFGRKINDLLTNGSGQDEPQGIEGAVTAIAPTTIDYSSILELFHSVDAAYRRSPQCGWMCSDSTLLNIKRTLLDADGRPIYKSQPDAVAGYPFVMEGKQVVVNTDLADGVILFGDFAQYHIRLVANMTVRVLNELFALTNGIGIVGHQAIDGRLVNADAIKKLVA